MNTRIVILSAVIVAVFGTAGAIVAQRSKIEEARTVTQVCTLKVDGMVCGACANRVEKVAKRVDGVSDAIINHEHGRATITYDPGKTTPAAIAKAITENAGFTSDVNK